MPRSRVEGRLVPVERIPERHRRSKYAVVLEEFLKGKAACARYETSREASAVAAALRTAARKRGLPVKVVVRNGEVYLEREE